MKTSTLSKSSSTSTKRDWMKILGIPVALLVFGLLITMKTPVGITRLSRMSYSIKKRFAKTLSSLQMMTPLTIWLRQPQAGCRTMNGIRTLFSGGHHLSVKLTELLLSKITAYGDHIVKYELCKHPLD